MDRPLRVVFFISIATAVGFICGMLFNTYYRKNVILQTIFQHNDVANVFAWYERIIQDKLALEDLASVKTMNDLESIKSKYQRNGASKIDLFRKQVQAVKKTAKNPSALIELERSVSEMESSFRNKSS